MESPENGTVEEGAAHIVVVNYAALPLSGDLTEPARDGYLRLRAFGPNDGLTLIADEILPGTRTLLAPGLDHFFRAPDTDERTLALVGTVLELVDRRA